MSPLFIIIMGVSGCGKTTIGQAVAAALGWAFYDADDFHSPENVAKMQAGVALTDADRQPWLATLHDLIATHCAAHRPGVLACSALKARYRQVLLAEAVPVQLVYVQGSYDLIAARLAQRAGHYMAPTLLCSQFAALEAPTEALVLEAAWPVAQAVQVVVAAIKQ